MEQIDAFLVEIASIVSKQNPANLKGVKEIEEWKWHLRPLSNINNLAVMAGNLFFSKAEGELEMTSLEEPVKKALFDELRSRCPDKFKITASKSGTMSQAVNSVLYNSTSAIPSTITRSPSQKNRNFVNRTKGEPTTLRQHSNSDFGTIGKRGSSPKPLELNRRSARGGHQEDAATIDEDSNDVICEMITKVFDISITKGMTEIKLNGKSLGRKHVAHTLSLIQKHGQFTLLEFRRASLQDDSLEEISKRIKDRRLGNVKSVDITENMFSLTALETLIMSLQNNFNLLSMEITEPNNSQNDDEDSIVQRIDFLCRVNKEIQQIKANVLADNASLKVIGRPLTSFPEEICVPQLKRLEITKCELTMLSPKIENLKNLVFLNLASNQLETLPGQIGLLVSLEELDLSSNQLITLPQSLSLLHRLQDFNVSSNKLTELPKFIGTLNLKSLLCSKNPFRKDMIVPRNIVAKGDDAILSYLKTLTSDSEASADIMRLFVLGNAGAGKTSLISSLKNRDLKTKPRQPSPTEGIELSKWIADEAFAFNVWDLSGQPQFAFAHSLFLSDRTMYLIVASLLEDPQSGKLPYWINIVLGKAGKAPVIIVGTYLDQASKDQVRIFTEYCTSMQQNFKSIISIATVSNVTLKGMKELQKDLIKLTPEQLFMRKLVPKNYRLLQQKIEALKETGNTQYLNLTTFHDICISLGFAGTDITLIIDFLVGTGDVAYYSLIANQKEQMLILDPQLLIKLLSTLISCKGPFIRDGIVSVGVLTQLWNTYSEYVPYLIDLLYQREIISKLEDGNILVPLLVRDLQPNSAEVERLHSEADTSLQYNRVWDFQHLPIDLFSRVIIRILDLGWKMNIIWKGGFIMTSKNNCQLVGDFETPDRSIKIDVRGSNSVSLFNDVVESVNNILLEWPKAKINSFVICPCGFHQYSVSELVKLNASNTAPVCSSKRDTMKIETLLPEMRSLATSSTQKKKSTPETRLYKRLDNLILEYHRMQYGNKTTKKSISDFKAKQEDLNGKVTAKKTQATEALSKVVETYNKITEQQSVIQTLIGSLQSQASGFREKYSDILQLLKEEIQELETAAKALNPDQLKNTIDVEPNKTTSTTKKSIRPNQINLFGEQVRSMQQLAESIEKFSRTERILENNNRRLNEKVLKNDEELKAFQAQLKSFEARQLELNSETEFLRGNLANLQKGRTIISDIESSIRNTELLDEQGELKPQVTANLSSLELNLSDLVSNPKDKITILNPESIDDSLEQPDLKIIKHENDEKYEVRAGTPTRLIERLSYSKYPDFRYQNALLLCYVNFLTPLELLEGLVLRYCATPPSSIDPFLVLEWQAPIRLRVMSTIRYWLDKFPEDLKDGADRFLKWFLDNAIVSTGNKQFAVQIRSILDRKADKAEKEKIPVNSLCPIPIFPDSFKTGKWQLSDFDPIEIARQIALLSHDCHRGINPRELLGVAWTKKDKQTRAPTIMRCIIFSNKLSTLVMEDILRREDINFRRAVLRKWLHVTRECFKLNDFNSVMNLTAALNHSVIHRLRKTWAGLSEDQTKEMQDSMGLLSLSPAKLKEMCRGATPPSVPLLGPYLTELVYIEEMPEKTEDGLLNFNKIRKLAATIQEIEQYGEQGYNFTVIPELRESVLSTEEKDDQILLNTSYKLEPKEPKPQNLADTK